MATTYSILKGVTLYRGRVPAGVRWTVCVKGWELGKAEAECLKQRVHYGPLVQVLPDTDCAAVGKTTDAIPPAPARVDRGPTAAQLEAVVSRLIRG